MSDDLTIWSAGDARPHQAMGAGKEFDTIRMLMARWGCLACDIGDDAAVLAPSGQNRYVVSTDACIEGVHFRSEWITPFDVGVRAAAAALSDLAAMGAGADYMLVSFVVPASWRSRLGKVADGIGMQVKRAGAQIVGGNLSLGPSFGLFLTVIGRARRPVPRSGAQIGDKVVVTGMLGGPGAALAAWKAGSEVSRWAHERFVHPLPRLVEGRLLADAGATAMIDISDGLAADARHVAAASGVDIVIDPAMLPLGERVTAQAALASGEEYELLATMPAGALRALENHWKSHTDVPLTVVGSVMARGPKAVEPHTESFMGRISGWDHFSGMSGNEAHDPDKPPDR